MERKFKFKAWNKKEQLLVRLNSIDCKRGELYKKDHILLQYTGFIDKNETELYEKDIVLFESEKYIILWDMGKYQWVVVGGGRKEGERKLIEKILLASVRLCNYYESPEAFDLS